MIGIFNNPVVAVEVGGLFGHAAEDIRDRANTSAQAESQGERATREDSYTDEFIFQVRGTISRRLDEVARRLSNTGERVEINFYPTNLPVSDETQYGADIGIRLTLRTPDITLVKGILVQCKRMYGPPTSPSYPELRGRGEKQAKDMLRITPASFYMLFNFGNQADLLNYASIPAGLVCPIDGGITIPINKSTNIGSSCPVWSNSAGSIWDMGIAMLPATRILALSASASARKTNIPVDVTTILRGCLPLGVFVTDLLGACFVGDVREEVIRIVTPRVLRDQSFAVTGLTDTSFNGFGVRHYIDIVISSERRGL